jgi:hypothetical protein
MSRKLTLKVASRRAETLAGRFVDMDVSAVSNQVLGVAPKERPHDLRAVTVLGPAKSLADGVEVVHDSRAGVPGHQGEVDTYA